VPGSKRRTFWEELAKNPDFTSTQVGDLHFGVTVGRLTRGHMPLVEALVAQRQSGKIAHARDLARLTTDDWTKLLQQQGNGSSIAIPQGFRAATPQLATQLYAAMLERNFTTAYPTVAFSARLASDPKPAFAASEAASQYLDANPAFDLRLSNIDAYAQTTPMSADVRSTLLAAQRLGKLNSNYSVMSALKSDGIHSAQQVYSMGRHQFVAKYGSLPALGATQAARTFAQAEQTYGVALALATSVNATLDAAGPAAVARALPTDAAEQVAAFPNLQTLFGSDSVCACSDCQSVLGAPAYLADMLEFLSHRSASDGRSVRDVLLARRPDIAQIELSCPNTDTELPYIDLVNELLEEAVAPPPAPPAPELPSRPLALKRQTSLTTPELEANPQWVNHDAYGTLEQAVYPWTLPFDLPLSEARAYLGQLGLDRVALIRTFQKPDGYPLSSPQARAIAVETLGMTAVEADIVTAGTLAAGHPSWAYWGLMQSGNTIADPYDPTKTISGTWVGLLSWVRVLLTRAGLSYEELARLLNTLFINGDGKITINYDPPDSCDVATMTIAWGTEDIEAIRAPLDRIHRFVRLWRRLGWDVYDLDDAIAILQHATAPGLPRLNDQLLRQLAIVATLAKRYSVPVREAIALFLTQTEKEREEEKEEEKKERTPAFATIPTRDVPTLPGDEVCNSLYHDLFQNLTVLNPPDPIFELNAAGTEIAAIAASPLLAQHAATLAAGLQITESDVNLAIEKFTHGKFTHGKLTLANLSAIYRNVRLAGMLGVTLTELVTLLAVAEAAIDPAPGYESVSPFDGTRPEAMLAFAGILAAVRASGLSIEQVDYIVRGVHDDASSVAPDPVSVGTLLLNLRGDLLKIQADTTPRSDPTGAATRKELTKLLSAPDIDTTMAILDGTSTLSPKDQDTFIASTLGPYMDSTAAQTNLVGVAALTPGQARFEYVLEKVLAYEQRIRGTGLVVQTLAQSLGVATATAALLINEWFPSASPPGTHAIDDFLALPTIPLTDASNPIPPDAAGFSQYFTTYATLAKTALIVTSLNLSADDVAWWRDTGVALGWLDPTTLPPSPAATAEGRFYRWSRLVTARKVRDDGAIPNGSFRTLFGAAGASTTKASYLQQLATLTQWSPAVLRTLCGDPATAGPAGLLTLAYPDDYRSEVALARLIPAIATVTRTGIPAEVSAWMAATVTPDVANAIKQGVKGRYPPEQWLTLAKQIRDPLRQCQRDALVSYLLAAVPPDGVSRWLDPEDVFAHFLIDVEMCACQATSRIVQATATVQLFVQRCFLALESPAVVVDPKDDDWSQWQWMSRYRVWQANREVFLFPENWMDPCEVHLFGSARFSGGEVLVDEAAEPVAAADRGGCQACRDRRWVPGFWRCEPKRTMRPMAVVVVDELVENVL
jgi:Salmonella virulence plasmid 28.1kDa A protein